MLPPPLQFLAAWLAVWLGRVLQQEVDYLTAENRLLREKLGGRKLRLTDAERRRQISTDSDCRLRATGEPRPPTVATSWQLQSQSQPADRKRKCLGG
jgi:hypothetical protein